MRMLILSIALLVSAANAAEPLTLKQLNLGDSEEVIRAAHPTIKCFSPKYGPDRLCEVFQVDRNTPDVEDLLDVGGEWSELTSMYYFDDKLGKATFYMGSGSFTQMIALLRTKYGPPTSQLGVPVQNKMGAKYMNDIVRWQRGGRIIEVEHYHMRLTHMMLTLKTADFDAKMARREREEAKRDAAKL